MQNAKDMREQCAREVSGLDCAHGCGVGAEIADKIRALPVPESNAGPCEAMHIGFDYLDNGQLVATYALPVRAEVAPKLYTTLTDWDALLKENEELKAQLSRLQNTVKFCERAAVHHAKTLPASDIVGMIANYPEIADITRQYGEEVAAPEFQTEILQKYAQLQQEARAIEANYEAARGLLMRYLDITKRAGVELDAHMDEFDSLDFDVNSFFGSAS